MVNSIKEILAKVLKLENAQLENLGNDDSLIDIGLNSLNAIEIIVNMEEAYDIMIDDEDLSVENLSSINQMCEMLKKYGV